MCEGCAIGGMLYSTIILGNPVKVSKLDDGTTKILNLKYFNSDIIHKKLNKIFPTYQLDLIESAFEGNVCINAKYN